MSVSGWASSSRGIGRAEGECRLQSACSHSNQSLRVGRQVLVRVLSTACDRYPTPSDVTSRVVSRLAVPLPYPTPLPHLSLVSSPVLAFVFVVCMRAFCVNEGRREAGRGLKITPRQVPLTWWEVTDLELKHAGCVRGCFYFAQQRGYLLPDTQRTEGGKD